MESFAPALVVALVTFVVSVPVLRKAATPARLDRLADRVPSRSRAVFSADDVRQQATGALNRLADELSRTDPTGVDRDLYERAGLARSEAERALDSRLLTDAVGALALARSGLDDLRAATGRSHARYRPCFFNPLHDQGTGEVDYTLGPGTVSVPACRACRAEVRRGGHHLDVLPSDTRSGQPYFLGDDEWAVTGYGALVEDLPTALFRYERARREATA